MSEHFFRRATKDSKRRSKDFWILHECNLLHVEDLLGKLISAIPLFDSLKEKVPSNVKSAVSSSLRACRKYIERAGQLESHVTLGNIPHLIGKLRTCEHVPQSCWECFGDESKPGNLMYMWEKNIEIAAADRDDLMHGNVLDIFEPDAGGHAPWKRLLANYIRVYPQVQWLTAQLEQNLKTLADEQKMPVGPLAAAY